MGKWKLAIGDDSLCVLTLARFKIEEKKSKIINPTFKLCTADLELIIVVGFLL